jgi:hypothetical protein
MAMADDFNPYHVWLGIPPDEQPANHYRLLSLRLFEASGDVIDSAADRQMAHLRTFQSGKHGELTQRLLNEVAAARICLLDPKKRAAYDLQLRVKLPNAAPTAIAIQTAAQSAAQPAIQPAKAPVPLQRAVATPAADKWDDLLGNPAARPAQKAGGKPANPLVAPSTKQAVKGRLVLIGIALGVVLIAGISFGVYSSLTSKTDGTLVFDWPDRTDVVLTVDNAPIEVPASGSWEHSFPVGQHHVAAQRPAFKFATDVNLAGGQRLSVLPDWKPKAADLKPLPIAAPVARVANDSNAAGRADVATDFPLNQWVDILRLVDPARNTVDGKWSLARNAISVEPKWGSRIAIPVAIDGSYDLAIKFASNKTEVTIPVGSHGVSLMLGGGDGTVCGFDTVDGRRPFEPGNPTFAHSPEIASGQDCLLLVKVRLLKADQASIDVLLNGKPLLPHWQGNPAALAVFGAWKMPTLDHPGLGAWDTRATFSSVRLRMISGRALADASVSST